jgi:hypothetical protein
MAAQHIVAVVGSYRRGGTIDLTVEALLEAAREDGATTETIRLADRHVRFCTNCRECTQAPGERRGACPIDDDVSQILDKMESADALVLASSVNNMDVTAVTRALIERMVGYMHWPFGAEAPRLRIERPHKHAVLISSSAMPGWMARLFTKASGSLKIMARLIGAKPNGSLFLGLSAGKPGGGFTPAVRSKARALGQRLVGGT